MIYNQEENAIIIDDKKFSFSKEEKNFALDINLNDFKGIELTNFIENLYIRLHSQEGLGSEMVKGIHLFETNDGKLFLDFSFTNFEIQWDKNYGIRTYLTEVWEQLRSSGKCTIDDDLEEIIFEDTGLPNITACYEYEFPVNIDKAIKECSKHISQIIEQTNNVLSGSKWRTVYETNEKTFSTELIFPLLRKMGFSDVRYTHGTREFGKDFTFSEITKFGNLRNFGMQVKAGNMRGNVNSDIDEIIGQIEDAFAIPYLEISANEERRINNFIIAISGKFTDNAKEKIAHKIPKSLLGCIYMIDKDKILELLEIHWKK